MESVHKHQSLSILGVSQINTMTHMNRTRLRILSTAALVMLSAVLLHAQAASRFVGAITAINGNTITVKTDAGEQHQVEVPAEASLKRIAPGQKDLSSAASIAFNDLAVGDRVLVRLDANATTPQASQIIAIKQEDLAKKQQHDREDWQRRGIAGLVKSVDPASGLITITTGAGPTAKTVSVTTGKSTVLKRYVPGSVKFEDAQPASIDAIHPGDQLRARGNKNADGTEIAAEDVVSGTFRHIAGTISSIDASGSTLTVKDLATKKQVAIHITPDSQLRKIPPQMAQMLAARLKGTMPPGGSSAGMKPQAASAAAGSPSGGRSNGGFPGGGAGNGDPQQMLNRAPATQLSELQKGEAVMVVATDGASDVNAISLLAGVEPLLEAPAASNLLSNWSMGGGGAEAAGGPQ